MSSGVRHHPVFNQYALFLTPKLNKVNFSNLPEARQIKSTKRNDLSNVTEMNLFLCQHFPLSFLFLIEINSAPLTTHQTKFEDISSKDVGGERFRAHTPRQIFVP